MGEKDYKKDLKKRHSRITFQKSGQYDWETPQDFFDELNKEFNFTLDPCCTSKNAKCDVYFTEKKDGLNKSWKGHTVFMNPPYGAKISKWVKKAYEESQKGVIVVCLLPARTDTRWWWDYCMKGEIRFIKGRLKFKGRNTKGELVNYPATFPSAIVIFKSGRSVRSGTTANLKKQNNSHQKANDDVKVHRSTSQSDGSPSGAFNHGGKNHG